MKAKTSARLTPVSKWGNDALMARPEQFSLDCVTRATQVLTARRISVHHWHAGGKKCAVKRQPFAMCHERKVIKTRSATSTMSKSTFSRPSLDFGEVENIADDCLQATRGNSDAREAVVLKRVGRSADLVARN